MARSNEEMVFCSFRMYLDNPQHLKIAKALKKIEADKQQKKSGITRNQFIADAIEYYLDNCDPSSSETGYITRKEMEDIRKTLKEEMLSIVRYEVMRSYNPFTLATAMPIQQMPAQVKEEKPDDTIADLVSEWD